MSPPPPTARRRPLDQGAAPTSTTATTHVSDSVPRTADKPRFVDVVLTAWHAGREYQPPGLAEAIDDARNADLVPRLSREERVAARLAEMEACAARVDDDNRAYLAWCRAHDARVLAAGLAWA